MKREKGWANWFGGVIAACLIAFAVFVLNPSFAPGQSNLPAAETSQPSEESLRGAVNEAERKFGPDSRELLKPLYSLGSHLNKTAKYSEALEVLDRILPIELREYGPEHPEVASTLVLMANLHSNMKEYAKAEPLYQRSLAIREKVLGPEHRDVATSLNRLATVYERQKQYAKAEPLYQRSLAIREKVLGPEHPDVASSLTDLASLYKTQGQYAKAEPLYLRAFAIRKKVLRPEHLDVTSSLNDLAAEAARLTAEGLTLYKAGKYAEAEPLLVHALTITEKIFGPEHAQVVLRLNRLGEVYRRQGKYSRAESLHLREMGIAEKVRGPEHPAVAMAVNALALVYEEQGRYSEAEPLYKRSLAIREKVLGPEHPDVARSLNNLAKLYNEQGEYAKAEPLYERSLAILEKVLGPEHPQVASSLNNLAVLYERQGKYVKVEPLFRRSLEIRENVLGPEHPDVANSLNNLANLYKDQGRYGEAEPLYERSLAIFEKVLGPEHLSVALSLHMLANLHSTQGQYSQAEPLYQRSLSIREKVLGPDHVIVAKNLNDLGLLYQWQMLYGKAEPRYERALAILEKVLGPEHADVATSLHNLAVLYRIQGQYTKAEPLYRRSLAISEKALGPEHPDVATSLNNLALLSEKQDRFVPARSLYERARHVGLASLRSNADVDDEALRGLLTQRRVSLLRYASLLTTIARSPQLDERPGSAQRDAFMVLEEARSGLAQSALAKSSARAAAEDPKTSTLARSVQDLRYGRQAITKLLDQEYGKPTAQRNQELTSNLQKERQKLDDELKEAVDRLNKSFPQYQELSAPDPITIDSVQKLLGADEAVLSFFTLDDRLLLWLVRKDKDFLYRDIEIKKEELKKLVTSVRVSLDQTKNPEFEANGKLAPFDVTSAHELYKLLFSPLKEFLSGIKRLIIVPDEQLLPLPFGTLITATEGETYKHLSELSRKGETLDGTEILLQYGKLPWLIKDYAITVLPSATSLRALRQIPRTRQKEPEQLIAFGDPVLGGNGAIRGGAMLASRGTFVPVEDIRKMNRLPGTRDELRAIAKALGVATADSLYLDKQATEPTVTKLNQSGRLAKAQVIAFSTHGLISGEIKGLKEPALVLTPPEKPTEEDDGLLGLEDILKLKLDSADWVVLSACNTGAADGSGEGLSGLTRAFFFAGARSLLVSHWSVNDFATQHLMTEIFQRYAKDKTIPRAEALRQGMLTIMNKARGETAFFAHPYAWAPFFVVGDR